MSWRCRGAETYRGACASASRGKNWELYYWVKKQHWMIMVQHNLLKHSTATKHSCATLLQGRYSEYVERNDILLASDLSNALTNWLIKPIELKTTRGHLMSRPAAVSIRLRCTCRPTNYSIFARELHCLARLCTSPCRRTSPCWHRNALARTDSMHGLLRAGLWPAITAYQRDWRTAFGPWVYDLDSELLIDSRRENKEAEDERERYGQWTLLPRVAYHRSLHVYINYHVG